MADTLVPRTFEEWHSILVISSKPTEFQLGVYVLKGQIVTEAAKKAFDKNNLIFSVGVVYPDGSRSFGFSLQLNTRPQSKLENTVAHALSLLNSSSYNDSLLGVRILRNRPIPAKFVNYLSIPGILETVIIQGKVGPYKQLSPVNVTH